MRRQSGLRERGCARLVTATLAEREQRYQLRNQYVLWVCLYSEVQVNKLRD